MTNVDIKELLLSGKNRLDVCNPFVYKQYKHFYSVGACISPSIKKWYHRLVSALGNLGKREKWGFEASRKVEIQKNNVSGCPDEWFFVKMSRRGVPKLGKSEKQVFGESRNIFIT